MFGELHSPPSAELTSTAIVHRADVKTASAGDPFEGVNRRIYSLNQGLDRVLLRPVSMTYRRVLPRPIRNALHNAIGNWDEPVVFVNDLLQIRLSDAGHTAARFAVNSTVGIVGIFDVAKRTGLPHHDNGFTLTMGRLGVKSGPYLYLPVIGPSSVRDIVGSGVDIVSNPLTAIPHIRSRKLEIAQTVVGAIDGRASVEGDLQTVNEGATDPYAFVRSVYRQHVEALIIGEEISLEPIPDLSPSPPTSSPKP